MSRIGTLYDSYLKKRPRQSRSRSVVEAVLVAATRALHKGEAEELTVQDVAESAGIGIGSLYDYFRDRESVMAAVAAKVTDDNLIAFEAMLEKTRTAPLREAVTVIVDHAMTTYTQNPRFLRAVLRIAHDIGLMPTLASSQTAFAASLAKALRERDDVTKENVDEKAWVLTNEIMGVMNAVIWADGELPFSREQIRATLIDTSVRVLSS